MKELSSLFRFGIPRATVNIVLGRDPRLHLQGLAHMELGYRAVFPVRRQISQVIEELLETKPTGAVH
jgi:hypothetical protein